MAKGKRQETLLDTLIQRKKHIHILQLSQISQEINTFFFSSLKYACKHSACVSQADFIKNITFLRKPGLLDHEEG